MEASSAATPNAALEADTGWTYDPWRERPRVATLAAVAALGLCVLVVRAHEPFLVALGLCVFCAASFSPALTPVECRIGSDGVARRGLMGWERRAWATVRRLQPLPSGLLLSPYTRPHWLDGTRGLTLPMPARDRARCSELVRREWEAARERD